jgi:hypothetical protein
LKGPPPSAIDAESCWVALKVNVLAYY